LFANWYTGRAVAGGTYSGATPRWFVRPTSTEAPVSNSSPLSVAEAADAPTIPIPAITAPLEDAATSTDPGVPRTGHESPLRLAQPADALDLLSGLMAICLLGLVYAGWPGVPRTLLTLAFTFFVPGRAIVTNWPRVARSSVPGMSMILSVGVLTLLATITLWAHVWHPLALFQIEAWLSLLGLGIGIARRHKHLPGS
jgi:hypothetical protein